LGGKWKALNSIYFKFKFNIILYLASLFIIRYYALAVEWVEAAMKVPVLYCMYINSAAFLSDLKAI
jgi:hypothetical protein